MTIKRRIFLTNSFMVFFALVFLLFIVAGMVALFKEEFLGWYQDNSQISENYAAVYESAPQMIENAKSPKELSDELEQYDYRLIVLDAAGKTVFQSARYCEEESAETLYAVKKDRQKIEGFFVENTTILTYTCDVDGETYEYYIVNCPSGVSIMGMDRGMFEMFLLVLFLVGIAAIVVILFFCQLMTKWLTKQILKPVNELDLAARRVMEKDLDTPICYEKEDEFKNTCDSFDLMQQYLKREMEKNHAYEVARTEMISGISHDLRTPLTSVKGYIKGMIDGIASTKEKQNEYLQIAYRKACDMDKLLSKLFYFSRLETGNMPFYFQTTDMKGYLLDYAEEKELELREKGAVLNTVFGTEADIYCDIDREQMNRVFDNLIENACKYAIGSGTLELTIGIRLTVREEQTLAEINFSDNGPGVPEEKLEKIFEQFYRGDEARNGEGNGLGLYVCKYVAEQHRGSISAYSKNGLHIVLTLPVVKGDLFHGENTVGGR